MTEYDEQDFENLTNEVENLRCQLADIIEVIKPLAIGSEQLWEVVYHDILECEVPNGIDVRKYMNKLNLA